MKLNEMVKTWTRQGKLILLSFKHRKRRRWLGPNTLPKRGQCEKISGHHRQKKCQKRTDFKETIRREEISAFRSRSNWHKTHKKSHCVQPGTKALQEIRQFQKFTNLLVLKRPFYRMVRELSQVERPWLKIQASAIMALHEAAEAYLIWLMEDSHICAIYTKWTTVMPKYMQLTRWIRGEVWRVSSEMHHWFIQPSVISVIIVYLIIDYVTVFSVKVQCKVVMLVRYIKVTQLHC